MRFWLAYDGPLKANGNAKHKHTIRKVLHSQMKRLWSQPPLVHFTSATPDNVDLLDVSQTDPKKSLIFPVGLFKFAPLVSVRKKMICDLEILLMRPEAPGGVITQGGDIDNRIKTLFDALRAPKHEGELPKNCQPAADETPFFCLLEDDFLITSVSVTTAQLLSQHGSRDVRLVIKVDTRVTMHTWDNISLV